jgi:NACHT domain
VSWVRRRPRADTRQRSAAGPWRLRMRWLLSRLSRPFLRLVESGRDHRRQPGVPKPPRWRGSRPLVRAVRLLSYLGAVLFVVWVVRALVAVVTGSGRFLFDFDEACRDTSFSCDALAGTLAPVLSIALVSAVFLLVRLGRVRRPYERRAREEPQDVVQTAGRIIGEVVGRDELCHVLIEDLRDPRTRRPQVVVGGVGTGKTALLVRLTEQLAQRGAVPVPVRLRDARGTLDFHRLARERFLAEAEGRLLSEAEGEKAWRHLLRNDQIVVLADGLEEALSDGDAERDRDNLIRLAIRQAHKSGLPLVVASRPHDPLREMEAAIVDLEPLSEEAALEYLRRRDGSQEEHRLDWIVETADVVETPLYLQITRQLHQTGLTEYVSADRDGAPLDTRSVDRAELRLRLLDTWLEGLVRGHYPSGLPLSHRDRQATVEQLSALACLGLRGDRLVVEFEELEGWRAQGDRAAAEGGGAAEQPSPLVLAVRERLLKLGRGFDVRLAASRGAELGLVEVRGDGVRFPHSIMQAYLGSRLIQVAMADERYRDDALKNPGRELLIALVMYSRARVREARPNGAAGVRVPGADAHPTRPLQKVLVEAAGRRDDVKALDLYAAALEIDSVDQTPTHADIVKQLREHWPMISARDERTLEEAKLNLVRRFGEAARTIAERHRRKEPRISTEPAYLELYRISAAEDLYPIRLAAAQEIGAGGDEAFAALQDVLGPQHQPDPPAGQAVGGIGEHGDGKVAGEPPADLDVPEEGPEQEEYMWREKVTRAWLAPLLVGSVTSSRAQGAARKNLDRWFQSVAATNGGSGELDLRLSLEVALAQGLKHAANRRAQHPHAQSEARAYLAEQAREMLKDTSFWFSRLTLVHALCLWSLPGSGQPHSRGRDADHRALVARWTARPHGGPEHPFVVEASKLAVLALDTSQPERFVWIDESGILARVGSRPANTRSRRKHNLWIPPSTGWTALHPRAQQLVADVLLLLNLAERGVRPSDRNRRLRRTDRADLPPCLAGERFPLDPTRTVGTAATSAPGSNCKRDCLFDLCPYPPKGEKSYRAELSEAFCRRQQALVSRAVRRKAAPWQAALPGDLRRFWTQMAHRTHRVEVDRERGGERGRSSARRAR